MIDRVAANGRVDMAPVDIPSSLYRQFPLDCVVTLLGQHSDIRKASAYRGYLRPTTGNHQIIGTAPGTYSIDRMAELIHRVHGEFGDVTFSKLPFVSDGILPVVVPAMQYATVFHFKWLRGLESKLGRRADTEKYTA